MVIAINEITSGERFMLVWTTDKSPAGNLDPQDGGARKVLRQSNGGAGGAGPRPACAG